MLLHTEYSLLSLLHTQDGVVHHHGLFQVSAGARCLAPSPAPSPQPWGWRLLGPPLYCEQLIQVSLHIGCSGFLGRVAGGQAGAGLLLQGPCCGDHSLGDALGSFY